MASWPTSQISSSLHQFMASLQHPWLTSSLTKVPTLIPSTNQHKAASFKPFKITLSLNQSNPDQGSSQPNSQNSREITPDPVKLAFERAKAYSKAKAERNLVRNSDGDRDKVEPGSSKGNIGLASDKEVPASVKAALEKAREYKKNKGIVGGVKNGGESKPNSSVKGEGGGNIMPNETVEKKVTKKEELKISSIDFKGFGFADKKQGRGLPPGLVPLSDPFPKGDLPDVEIIVGDMSRFGGATTTKAEQVKEDGPDLYKPKVSTWGVFPRPSNISSTFGGGRVIQPGEVLETAEERAAKDERTRQLLAAYKKRTGLYTDPKLKAECEKVLKDGDLLMDSGKLEEALPYYEEVMEKMGFKSELHGLAALQWSICQDSLTRANEAQIMYEKLQSHPDVKVSKRAKQLMFSFQAMDIIKLSSSNISLWNTGYQTYFDAFVEDKSNYPLEEVEVGGDSAMTQALPYVIFLFSPIILVLFIAVQKGNIH